MCKAEKKTVFAKKTAALLLILIMLLSGGCSGGSAAEKDESGNYTAEGAGICTVEEQDITYTVYLRVTADPDGKILSIEDAGTEVPDGKDGLYRTSQQLFDILVGKNLDDLQNVDVISGATCSSKAIMEAVEDALDHIAEAKDR